MKFNAQNLMICAIVEFFLALPLFFLMFPSPVDFVQGYDSTKINYGAPQLLVFYGLMVTLVLKMSLGYGERTRKKISNILKFIGVLAAILFLLLFIFAGQTAINKISYGKSIFYDDSKDCRYIARTNPFYKLKPGERNPKNC